MEKIVLKLSSILTSLLPIVYGAIILIIDNGPYLMSYNHNRVWTVVVIAVIACNLTLTVISKSKLAYSLSIFSIVPYTLITDIGMAALIIPLVYLAVYLTCNILAIKISGSIVCSLIILILVFIIISPSPIGSSYYEEISLNHYVSPNRDKEVYVEISYWNENSPVDPNTYSCNVSIHTLNLVNLGPVVFHGQYSRVFYEELLTEKPTVNFEWLDNNTISINGETIVVK